MKSAPLPVSTVLSPTKLLKYWVKGKRYWARLLKFRDDEHFRPFKESLIQKCRDNACLRVIDGTFNPFTLTAGSDDE